MFLFLREDSGCNCAHSNDKIMVQENIFMNERSKNFYRSSDVSDLQKKINECSSSMKVHVSAACEWTYERERVDWTSNKSCNRRSSIDGLPGYDSFYEWKTSRSILKTYRFYFILKTCRFYTVFKSSSPCVSRIINLQSKRKTKKNSWHRNSEFLR